MKPTAKQKRQFAKSAEFGCLACYLDGNQGTPAHIHHAHEYGYRNHDIFYPLCPIHHAYQHAVSGIPNRHKNPIEFINKYGNDTDLHNLFMQIIDGSKQTIIEDVPF